MVLSFGDVPHDTNLSGQGMVQGFRIDKAEEHPSFLLSTLLASPFPKNDPDKA